MAPTTSTSGSSSAPSVVVSHGPRSGLRQKLSRVGPGGAFTAPGAPRTSGRRRASAPARAGRPRAPAHPRRRRPPAPTRTIRSRASPSSSAHALAHDADARRVELDEHGPAACEQSGETPQERVRTSRRCRCCRRAAARCSSSRSPGGDRRSTPRARSHRPAGPERPRPGRRRRRRRALPGGRARGRGARGRSRRRAPGRARGRAHARPRLRPGPSHTSTGSVRVWPRSSRSTGSPAPSRIAPKSSSAVMRHRSARAPGRSARPVPGPRRRARPRCGRRRAARVASATRSPS